MRHPDLATGHRQHLRLVDVEVPPKRRVPPVPVGLSKEGSAHWRRLWRSRVAVEWDTESDRAAVERYLRMLERWRRFDQLVARAPLVQGSKGQLRPNPLTTQVVALEGQVRSEAAFAKLCGACPIPASSGKTNRYRLNRGGNRQANAALYRAVIVRLRWHQPTIDYLARRTAEGLTKRESIRCLKRYLAREVFALLPPLIAGPKPVPLAP